MGYNSGARIQNMLDSLTGMIVIQGTRKNKAGQTGKDKERE